MRRIDFYCGPSHEAFSPKSSEEGRGGSEEMVIGLAKELAKLGNKVIVWNRCLDDEGTYDKVVYKNYDEFDIDKTDILIIWRSPQLYLSHKLDKVKAKKYLWLHDTIPQLDVLPYLFAFDGIFCLSNWHKNYYIQLTPPELRKRFIVTRNAVDTKEFEDEIVLGGRNKIWRDPYTIVYGSLYNRGLLELLSVWPTIKSEVPEAKLRIFYGWQTLEKILPMEDFKKFKEEMEFQMDQEGITHLGRISHKEVAKEMLGAGIWAYPCINFNEISCITAMKAQIGGAIPVVIPKAALGETVKYGLRIGRGTDNADILNKWTKGVIKVLRDHKGQEALRKLMMKNTPKLFDYEGLAKSWQEVFNV